jgi:hypothetical protein
MSKRTTLTLTGEDILPVSALSEDSAVICGILALCQVAYAKSSFLSYM